MRSNSLDLTKCSAPELASWLLENRFANDQTETTTYLLESIGSLPDAEQISEQLVASVSAQEDTDVEPDTTDSLLQLPTLIACTTPRCKFQVFFTPQGIVFEEAATRTSAGAVDGNQQKHRFVVSSVAHLIAFPKPRDCQPQKTTPPDMLLLVLPKDSGVIFKQKPLSQLCFQLPSELPSLKNHDDDDDLSLDGLDPTDQWLRLCCEALQGIDQRSIIRVVNPAMPKDASDNHFWRYQFRSYQDENVSTTTGDLPFVPCYMGVKDGSLYPLQEGLLFFAPPLFLPRSSLQSIECGRAGNNSSRYVDLTVTTDDGERIEFTNIRRDETTVLNEYIHRTLIPAMQKDVEGASTASVAVVASRLDDIDADEDALDASMETHPPTARKSKRKAGLEAMRINKHVLSRSTEEGQEDDSSDDDFDANRTRANEGDASDNESSESNDEDSDEDEAAAETDEDETESEEEEADARTTTKKARNS